MQNYIKSQTRLAFVQYIFQLEFNEFENFNSIDEFQQHFYNSNIASIGEKKEFKLRFNKNFLKNLSKNYIEAFEKEKIISRINDFTEINRKFDTWNGVLKSLIFAIISELQMSEENKFKIILNDYINVSKSLISLQETKLMNAIIQKFLNEKKNIK